MKKKILNVLFTMLCLCTFPLYAAQQNTVVAAGSPPGLGNKGVGSPHGLQKQGKTPYGWGRGQKRGWNKGIHKHRTHPFHPDHPVHPVHPSIITPSN